MHGAYKHLMQELRLGNRSGYRKFLRMDPESFGLLESFVAPFISRKDTNTGFDAHA